MMTDSGNYQAFPGIQGAGDAKRAREPAIMRELAALSQSVDQLCKVVAVLTERTAPACNGVYQPAENRSEPDNEYDCVLAGRIEASRGIIDGCSATIQSILSRLEF